MTADPLAPIHPGEILREEFLAPLGFSPSDLAVACGADVGQVERLTREEAPLTPDLVLRLARYFSMTPHFWAGIQSQYDLELARRRLGREIAAIRPRQVA